jgi:monovalent cation/hydrogen antiporter
MQHLPLLATAVTLALAVAALSVLARRLQVPPPMLMLLAGVAVSFVPGAPAVALDPEAVFLVLLPPLLYSSGVGMSWRGFRDNLRPILLLAVGCVLVTALAVATVMHFAFGLSWSVGMVLGAVVAPPDAVAPMAIVRRLGLPQRLITVLEGESLMNDATALVLFSFALAAVGGADLTLGGAAVRFGIIAAGETVWGIAIAALLLRLRHLADDARAEVLLALATPFLAFWPPHALGGSGVVACVVAGLFVSWNGRRLIRTATRLQGYFIWDLLNWVIEALLFLLTGLQARAIVIGLADGELWRAVSAGLLASLTVIVVRYLWVFPAAYVPRMIPAIRRRDPFPNWRLPFLVAFTGLRGAVSLAAALSIPLLTTGGPFPQRDLLLASTFIVIAVTLVGLGAALPAVIRLLGLARSGIEEAAARRRTERAVRLEGIARLQAVLDQQLAAGAPADAVEALRRQLALRSAQLAGPDGATSPATRLHLQLIETERETIGQAYLDDRLSDESRRQIERELDLKFASLQHTIEQAGPDEPGASLAPQDGPGGARA